MAKSDVYVLELTRDEAVALAMLSSSGADVLPFGEFITPHLVAIGKALTAADETLDEEQFVRWDEAGGPLYGTVQEGEQ